MKKYLHIITKNNEVLSRQVIECQKQKQTDVVVLDISEQKPDYKRLLDEIFKADSVFVW